MSVAVVLNRNARLLSQRSPLRRAILDEAARAGARVHETQSLAELDRATRELADHGASVVVLGGGDGSHMAGITALSRAYGGQLPVVALAPAGTVCTIARNLTPPRATESAGAWGRRVARAALAGTARPELRATLRVRDGAGGDRVGFIFGAGLVARFFELYDRAPRQGLVTAARIAARAFVGSFVGGTTARRILEPVRCALTVDGDRHAAGSWSLVLASVVRDLGLHMRPTYRAGEAPDRFHVVASGLSPGALGPQMLRVMAARPIQGLPRVDALARSLSVRFDEPSGAYVLDGEWLEAPSVSVEAGPQTRVLVT